MSWFTDRTELLTNFHLSSCKLMFHIMCIFIYLFVYLFFSKSSARSQFQSNKWEQWRIIWKWGFILSKWSRKYIRVSVYSYFYLPHKYSRFQTFFILPFVLSENAIYFFALLVGLLICWLYSLKWHTLPYSHTHFEQGWGMSWVWH